MKIKTMMKAALAAGAASLIVSGGAMAAAVPLTTLSAHAVTNPNTATPLDYTINDAGFQAGATFDANGNLQINDALVQATAMCSSTDVTCTLLDGSGDGMMQYLVKNTSNGKSFVELINGSSTVDDGKFFNETFVTYNGNSPSEANSVASKSIIQDTLAVANLEGGFNLSSEWLRGAFQTATTSFTNANTSPTSGVSQGNAGGRAIRMDAITSQVINGVVAFTYTGMSEENGAPGGTGAANTVAGDVTIEVGTNAGNTLANLADAQSVGVFAYRSTGGQLDGIIDYTPTQSQTITLGTSSINTGTLGSGLRAMYVGQQMTGFNGSQTDSYTTDDRTKREFGYIRYTTTAGMPSTATGSWTDTQLGVGITLASISMSSQGGATAQVTGTTAASNTLRETDYLVSQVGAGSTAYGVGAGGEGTFTNSAGLLSQWSALFGVSAPPSDVDNGF